MGARPASIVMRGITKQGNPATSAACGTAKRVVAGKGSAPAHRLGARRTVRNVRPAAGLWFRARARFFPMGGFLDRPITDKETEVGQGKVGDTLLRFGASCM